jgi:hypothetical protein
VRWCSIKSARTSPTRSVCWSTLTAREQAQLLRLLSKMNGVSKLHYTRRARRPRRHHGVAALGEPQRQHP